MNFGRFFKFNQSMSDMVAGITIFDYTELPAYEGLASDNPSSPKYPITLTITDDAVHFKMHYCIYRCSNAEKEKQSDDSAPIYGFSFDDINRQLYSTHPGNSNDQYEQNHNIVHIEEVILELPFTGFRANELTEIIKKSYIASFPQIYENYEKDESDDIRTGNRFLDQLIKKELSNHNLDSDAISYSTLWLMDLYDESGNISLRSKGKDRLLDKFLRKLLLDFMFDMKHSNVFQTCVEYDQMCSGLMSDYYFSALMHKCEYYYYRDLTTQAINAYEKKKLQFKLEGKDDKDLEPDKERIIRLYAKELFDAEEQWANDIHNPQSEELFEHNFPFSKTDQKRGRWLSEARSLICERMTTTCWDSWFANPEEEMRRIYFPFKTYHNHKDVCNSITLCEYFYNSPEIKELYPDVRASRGKSSRWFLNRYDFNDVLHLHLIKHTNILFLTLAISILVILWCSDSVEYLANLLTFFSKTLHKLPSILFIVILLVLTSIFTKMMDSLYSFNLEENHSSYVIKKLLFPALTIAILMLALFTFIPSTPHKVEPFQGWMLFFLIIIAVAITIAIALSLFLWLFKRCKGHETLCLTIPAITLTILTSAIYSIYKAKPFQEKIFFFLIICAIVSAICFGIFLWKRNRCWSNEKSWPQLIAITLSILASFALISFILYNVERFQGWMFSFLIATIFSFITLSIKYCWFIKNVWIHPIKNGHLFLPKLTASIMTAWLTLSRGLERILPFFENYIFVIILSIIVFGFIMYQVNKTCPKSSTGAKICKSLEFMVISYCISLIVGLVVINYMGRNVLEQDKYLNANYMSYVEHHESDIILYDYKKENDNFNIDTTWVKLLYYKPVMDEKEPMYKKTIIRLPLVGSSKGILVIPRFWLMSSILAMFIGVFLQMVFFQDKQMTDI